MRPPNRLNDSPKSDTALRQARTERENKHRFDFKTGKLFSSAGGVKKRGNK